MVLNSVDKQMEILIRGVSDLVGEQELRRKLKRSAVTGTPLRVKLGIDPTGRDLTLGHTVPLRKLKQFMDLGHHCILIIGDYTAMIGDPTGRNESRPQLTHTQTTENAARFLEQTARVLDVSKLEVRRNSEWLAAMTFADVARLAARSTVAHMLEREDFKQRHDHGRPIHIHEFFYPLMQGTDSVAIRADIELGGTDQKFNLLMGRDLQREAGLEPQVCMMTPIVEGLDGVAKMSKSLGNYIGLDHGAGEIFGRTMSIPDRLIVPYFTHFTDVPDLEIERIKAAMAADENPMVFKRQLGREIITTFGHGPGLAREAESKWLAQFSRREVPGDVPDVVVSATDLPAQAARLLVLTGLIPSFGQARRLIEQGGVTIDGDKVTDPAQEMAISSGQILKAGKRQYGRLVVKE